MQYSALTYSHTEAALASCLFPDAKQGLPLVLMQKIIPFNKNAAFYSLSSQSAYEFITSFCRHGHLYAIMLRQQVHLKGPHSSVLVLLASEKRGFLNHKQIFVSAMAIAQR